MFSRIMAIDLMEEDLIAHRFFSIPYKIYLAIGVAICISYLSLCEGIIIIWYLYDRQMVTVLSKALSQIPIVTRKW